MTFVTGTASGNTLTRIAWSSKLHRETRNRFFFQQKGMVRADVGDEPSFERRSGTPIVSQEALNGRRAQEVRVAMQRQLTTNRSAVTGTRSLDAQTYGTATMIDNEETMELYNMDCWVEQMKHATSFNTPEIQDLRTEFKMTVRAADVLADWMSAEMEESVLDAAYDKYSGNVVGTSLASAANPPSNSLQYAGNQSSDATVTSSDTLTSAELRRVYAWCDVNNINPIRHMGRDCYIMLAHTYNYVDLNSDSEFREAFQHGWQRASTPSNNPLFDMADAEYMGIYVHKYNRIRVSSANANAYRCLVLGSDALAEGVTSRPRLVRRKEDAYEDTFGLGIKAICGWSRADWSNQGAATTVNQSMAIWSTWGNTSV